MKQDIKPGHAQLTDLAYWINERHSIYCKRAAGVPWPWTDDPILRDWKFTNAFRQLDKGTVWLRRMLEPVTSPDLIVFNVMWYRLFNWWEHAQNLGATCSLSELEQYIRKCHGDGKQVFTGAHMTTGRAFEDKHETYLEACKMAWERRLEVLQACLNFSMAEVFEKLLSFYMVGRFVAYEIVCDFRFVLSGRWRDTLAWANMGPGAKRGLTRLGAPCDTQKDGVDSMVLTHTLLLTNEMLSSEVLHCEWPFELREVEHSLCEFDKYQRVKTGAGRPRSRYEHHE